MTQAIHASFTASVTDLKRDPTGTVRAGEGAAVAILNRNAPVFYCVPAATYEAMLERLEDAELNALASARADMPEVSVHLDDL
jgi:antitoxin StbD